MRWHVLLSFLLCVGTAWAQERCFCLRDNNDNWRKGCEIRRVGLAQQLITFCNDAVTGDKQPVEHLDGWQRIPEGQEGCTCEALRPGGPTGPRGDSKTEGQNNASNSGNQPDTR